MSRSKPNAVKPLDEIVNHVMQIVTHEVVETIESHVITLKANTFCVHGDNPKALDILSLLNDHFNVVK